MAWLKKARVVVGVMAAITLLSLFIAEAMLQGTTLKTRTVVILLSIISGTLAVDIISQELPIKITLDREEGGD